MRVIALVLVLGMAACAGESGEPDPPRKPDPPKGDFSHPEAAVKTFIDAATRKDLPLLGKCFSADSEREFSSLRDGSANDKMLDELKEMFSGATVSKIKLGETNKTAEVGVNLAWSGRKTETLEMVHTDDGWKIRGF